MDSNLLEKKLIEAAAIIEECRAAVAQTDKSSSRKSVKVVQRDKPMTLAEHLLQMRDDGFFKELRTAEEAHQALETTYPCLRKRVIVELIRLSSKRELRKASKSVNGRNLTAYVWNLVHD